MEKALNEVVKDLTDKIHLAEISIKRLEEQGERRIEARMREQELQARILEAQTKWRPKDWFILSGIIGAVVVALAGLAVTVVLAFSYVPRTNNLSDVTHEVKTIATDNATNNPNADFVVK